MGRCSDSHGTVAVNPHLLWLFTLGMSARSQSISIWVLESKISREAKKTENKNVPGEPGSDRAERWEESELLPRTLRLGACSVGDQVSSLLPFLLPSLPLPSSPLASRISLGLS